MNVWGKTLALRMHCNMGERGGRIRVRFDLRRGRNRLWDEVEAVAEYRKQILKHFRVTLGNLEPSVHAAPNPTTLQCSSNCRPDVRKIYFCMLTLTLCFSHPDRSLLPLPPTRGGSCGEQQAERTDVRRKTERKERMRKVVEGRRSETRATSPPPARSAGSD